MENNKKTGVFALQFFNNDDMFCIFHFVNFDIIRLNITFFYQIYNQKGELCIEGNTKMLAYDYKNQKVRKIPNHFLKRIEEYGM